MLVYQDNCTQCPLKKKKKTRATVQQQKNSCGNLNKKILLNKASEQITKYTATQMTKI